MDVGRNVGHTRGIAESRSTILGRCNPYPLPGDPDESSHLGERANSNQHAGSLYQNYCCSCSFQLLITDQCASEVMALLELSSQGCSVTLLKSNRESPRVTASHGWEPAISAMLLAMRATGTPSTLAALGAVARLEPKSMHACRTE